jgi:hypothetical protein
MGCLQSTPVVQQPEYVQGGISDPRYDPQPPGQSSQTATQHSNGAHNTTTSTKPETATGNSSKTMKNKPFVPPPQMTPPPNKKVTEYVPPAAIPAMTQDRGREPDPPADMTQDRGREIDINNRPLVSRRGGSPGMRVQVKPPIREVSPTPPVSQRPPTGKKPRPKNATFEDVYMRGKEVRAKIRVHLINWMLGRTSLSFLPDKGILSHHFCCLCFVFS